MVANAYERMARSPAHDAGQTLADQRVVGGAGAFGQLHQVESSRA